MPLRHFLSKISFFYILIRGMGMVGSSIALIIMLSTWGYLRYGPQPTKLSPMQESIGTELISKSVDQFPWSKEVGKVLMLPVKNDWDAFYSNGLRDRVFLKGKKFEITQEGGMRRVMKDLHLYNTPDLSEKDIRKILENMVADTLLVAHLVSYTEDPGSAVAELKCVFFKKDGKIIPITAVVERKKAGLLTGIKLLNKDRLLHGKRIFFAFCAVLLFPLMVLPITLIIVRKQSAFANIFLVASYSIVLIALGVWWLGPIEGIWHGILAIALSLGVVLYMLYSCEFVASMSGVSTEK